MRGNKENNKKQAAHIFSLWAACFLIFKQAKGGDYLLGRCDRVVKWVDSFSTGEES